LDLTGLALALAVDFCFAGAGELLQAEPLASSASEAIKVVLKIKGDFFMLATL